MRGKTSRWLFIFSTFDAVKAPLSLNAFYSVFRAACQTSRRNRKRCTLWHIDTIHSPSILAELYDAMLGLPRPSLARRGLRWACCTCRYSTGSTSAHRASPADNNGKANDDDRPTQPQTRPSVRLLRLARPALAPNFYRDRPAYHFSNPFFVLAFRPIRTAAVREINLGPTWLRGDYPAGVLEGRHERRRPINDADKQPTTFRETSEDGSEDGLASVVNKEHRTHTEPTSAKRPLLVHGKDLVKLRREERSLSNVCRVPVLVLTSKKRLDKRAFLRNKIKKRLLTALDAVLWRHVDGLPTMDEQGKGNGMVCLCMSTSQSMLIIPFHLHDRQPAGVGVPTGARSDTKVDKRLGQGDGRSSAESKTHQQHATGQDKFVT